MVSGGQAECSPVWIEEEPLGGEEGTQDGSGTGVWGPGQLSKGPVVGRDESCGLGCQMVFQS